MQLSNVFDDLDKLVRQVSNKFSTSVNMDREDLYQELWVCLLEKKIDNPAMANRVLRNKAIDLYRRSNSRFYSAFAEPSRCLPNTFEDVNERFVFSNAEELGEVTEIDMSDYMIESLLSSVTGKERKYIIVRCYLSAGVTSLYSEYSKIVETLTDDQRFELFVADSDVKREDCIAKYIFGYKSRNSSPYREMKVRVRDLYRSLV